MDNAVKPVEQPFEPCSLLQELFRTIGACPSVFSSIAIEINLKKKMTDWFTCLNDSQPSV